VVCGVETKGAALLCGRCLGKIDDPLVFLPFSLDPTSDHRLFQVASASLRIGPTSTADTTFSKGLEPALRLREIQASKDVGTLSQFINRYLMGLGIGLYLRGDERIPRRGLILNIMKGAEGLELNTEQWASASVRMVNIYSLLARALSTLPIDPSAALPLARKNADTARRLYSRSSLYPALNLASSANEAMLDHWTGDSNRALLTIERLLGFELSEDDRSHLMIVKATILVDTGETAKAVQIVESLPGMVKDSRVPRLKALTEGSE
jgi:hypothetical protein